MRDTRLTDRHKRTAGGSGRGAARVKAALPLVPRSGCRSPRGLRTTDLTQYISDALLERGRKLLDVEAQECAQRVMGSEEVAQDSKAQDVVATAVADRIQIILKRVQKFVGVHERANLPGLDLN